MLRFYGNFDAIFINARRPEDFNPHKKELMMIIDNKQFRNTVYVRSTSATLNSFINNV